MRIGRESASSDTSDGPTSMGFMGLSSIFCESRHDLFKISTVSWCLLGLGNRKLRLTAVSHRAVAKGSVESTHKVPVPTTLDRVSGVVCGDACVPGYFGCGLARESAVGGVGFEVGL